jgi:1,2-phenylacetyl-CoA epoxidase PaaB subunit
MWISWNNKQHTSVYELLTTASNLKLADNMESEGQWTKSVGKHDNTEELTVRMLQRMWHKTFLRFLDHSDVNNWRMFSFTVTHNRT